MTLSVQEFVRRFCLHRLPERFVKIRHYGLLSNRNREQRLARARESLGAPAPHQSEPMTNAPAAPVEQPQPMRCPFCGAPALIWMEELPPSHRARPVAICDSS